MLRGVIRPCIQEQGRTVGCVAARRNVDDGVPWNRSDIGIVKAVPAGVHLLEAVIVTRVHRAPTVDDNSTEMVLAILRRRTPRHRATQVVVERNSRGEVDSLWMFAESVRAGLDHPVSNANSQACQQCQEAGSPLTNCGSEKLGLRPCKVRRQKLNRRHGVRRARQFKDPDVSHTEVIRRQGVLPLPHQFGVPGPRRTIPGPRLRAPEPRCRRTKVGRQILKEESHSFTWSLFLGLPKS